MMQGDRVTISSGPLKGEMGTVRYIRMDSTTFPFQPIAASVRLDSKTPIPGYTGTMFPIHILTVMEKK